MKIGIVTYHRSHNYGALLQAIAIRVVLKSLGHDAYYVDYWPSYHRRMYSMINFKQILNWHIRSNIKYLHNLCLTYKSKNRRRLSMFKFIKEYIEPYCLPTTEKFDIIIYGSDQIWRKQSETHKYNPVYFGKNEFKTKKNITYAASMGIIPTSIKEKETIQKLVSNLDAISVREKSLAQLLETLHFSNVRINLDPTLLLTQEQWNNIIPSQNYNGPRYLLYYNLQPNAFSLEKIRKFAIRKGLTLKIIYGNAIKHEDKNNISSTSADGFLELIRHSEFVFTSSYHGLVFSLLYAKPFYASFETNVERAKSILSILGLQEYLLSPKTDIPEDFKEINYKQIFTTLNSLRAESIDYLKQFCKQL